MCYCHFSKADAVFLSLTLFFFVGGFLFLVIPLVIQNNKPTNIKCQDGSGSSVDCDYFSFEFIWALVGTPLFWAIALIIAVPVYAPTYLLLRLA